MSGEAIGKTERALEASTVRHFPSAADPGELPVNREVYEQIIVGLNRHFTRSQTGRTLLIAGGLPGEGTSTVSRDLARVLAQHQGVRVLLIDANLRNPTQHEAFDLPRSGGLSDVTSDNVDLNRAVTCIGGSRLYLLNAGTETDNTIEVLGSTTLASALSELRGRFDWIVIDAPPVTQFTDAVVLAQLADATMLVIHAERTRSAVVAEAKKRLEQSGNPVVGAVLNRRKYHIPRSIYRWL